MKILHITDSHGFHNGYNHDWDNIDIVIHTGDASNSKTVITNEQEFKHFLYWYNNIPVKHKIYVAGNHDTFLYKHKDLVDWGDIIYLEDDYTIINDVKIYGTPWCPVFNDWAFMLSDNKLYKYFDNIPDDTDILCTHTPPRTVLDLANKYDGTLEYCGSKHLLNKVEEINPKYHLFGHIHNNGININYGILKRGSTTFINSTGVVDRKFYLGLVNQGHLFTWK